MHRSFTARRLSVSLFVLLAPVLTACGSTVGGDRVAVSADGSGLGLGSVDAGADSASATGQSAGIGASAAAGEGASGSGEPVVGDPAAPSAGESFSGSTISAPTTSFIEIGIPYFNSQAQNALLGNIGAGLATNDEKQLYEAYLRHLNDQGGLLGRKLKGVYYEMSSSDDVSSLGAQICAYYTQDHKVPFVLAPDLGNNVYPCLSKHGIGVLFGGVVETSNALMKSNPTVLLPDTIAMDRLQEPMTGALDAMGYFPKPTKPTEKLGVIYYDNAAPTAAFHAFEKALSTRGLKLSDSVAVTQYTSASDLAALEVAVKAAELRFSSEGITHVMCIETNAFICGFFGLYAGQQGYYPRYAFSSMQPLGNVTANLSPRSLQGSVFVGWHASQDLQFETEMPAATRTCLGVFRKAGFTIDTANKREQSARMCTIFNVFTASLSRSKVISAAGLLSGAKQLGRSPQSVDGFEMDLGAHRDGVSAFRSGSYVPSCDCYRYTGGNIRI